MTQAEIESQAVAEVDKRVVGRRIARRLLPIYLAAALQSFVLWYAIEKPFLRDIGLSPRGITTVVMFFNIGLIVMNLPVGIVSDRWSRKGMLMVGGVGMSIASLLGGLSNGASTYILAMLFFALYQASYSGGNDSAVYDVVLEETGSGDLFSSFYGRVRAIEGVALSAGSLAGGLAAALIGTRSAYFITVPFAVLSVVALTFFDEPTIHKAIGLSTSTKPLRYTGELLRRRHTSAIIFSSVAVFLNFYFMTQLDPLWLLALHLPLVVYGPFNALLLACLAIGGYVAGRSSARVHRDLYAAAVALVASCGLIVHNTATVLTAQCVFLAALTFLNISLSQRLHDATPSEVRSAVSSVVATIAMIVFAPTAVLFGALTQSAGVFHAAWITVAIAALALAGVTAINRTSAAPKALAS